MYMKKGNSGIFSHCSGAEIKPHSQWNLGDCFPNLERKKSQSELKMIFNSSIYCEIQTRLFEMMFMLLFNDSK